MNRLFQNNMEQSVFLYFTVNNLFVANALPDCRVRITCLWLTPVLRVDNPPGSDKELILFSTAFLYLSLLTDFI